MKPNIVLAAGLALGSFGASAQSAVTRVSGSFWENGATRAFFDLTVAPGDVQRMSLSGGRSIEVARLGNGGPTIRFLDAKGRELESTSLGNGTADRAVVVAACGARIVFSSSENQLPCSTQ